MLEKPSKRKGLSQPSLLAKGIALLCFIFMMLCVIVSMLFRDTTVNPSVSLENASTSQLSWVAMPPISSGIAFVIALTVSLLFLAIPKNILSGISRKWYLIAVFAIDSCLLGFQLFLADSIRYKSTWDPGRLLSFAIDCETGGDLEQYRWYFETFSNNNSLALLLRLIVRISIALGTDPSLLASLIGTVLVNIAGILLFLTTYKLGLARKHQLAALFLYTVLGGLSLWIAVPYSDSYVAPFVSLVLLCIVHLGKAHDFRNRVVAAVGLGLSLSFGALLKPTILILGIACLIGAFASARCSLAHIKALMITVLAAFLPFAFVMGMTSSYVDHHLGIEVDQEKPLTISHFLMMGANPDRYGLHSSEDTAFSAAIDNKSERTAENLRVFNERVAEMGPLGYAKFLTKKLVLTFCDGKFGVGLEGQHFPLEEEYLYPNPHGAASQALRDYYYGDREVLDNLDQVLWYVVLCSAPFSYLFYRRNVCTQRRSAWVALVSMMCFVGLVAFFLLFETRSRYLYCFLPLFCLLAAMGLSGLDGYAGCIRRKISLRRIRSVSKTATYCASMGRMNVIQRKTCIEHALIADVGEIRYRRLAGC